MVTATAPLSLHNRGPTTLMIIMSNLLLLLSLLLSSTTAASDTAPNIVFVLADDLGWNDIGFHNPQIISPNLDALARSGVILDQAYVQPLCSPSRAALMTGVYPFRYGLQHAVILGKQAVCAPRERPFLSEVLKEAGYATHIVGKWHLGFCNWNCTPTYRGFDSFYGYYNGEEDYYSKMNDFGFDFRDGEKVDRSAEGQYSTYLYRDRVNEIIADHDTSNPLFLYLPFQNVHRPLQAPEGYLGMYPNVTDQRRRSHNALVTVMDDAIGDLVAALKTKGIYNNTLIVFSADNGGMVGTAGNNYPLRGGKFTVFEGGTRAAAFVHGPMLNNTGVRYEGLMHIVDWFPTLLEAAGIDYNDTDQDGVSQWQPLLGLTTPSNRQEVVYNIDDSMFPIQGKAAIRVGDYKLIDGYPGVYPDWYKPGQTHDSFGPIENRRAGIETKRPVNMLDTERFKYLFNLKDDPNERVNLYDSHPDIVKQLESRLEEHRKKYVAPKFPFPDAKSDPVLYGGAWSPGWC